MEKGKIQKKLFFPLLILALFSLALSTVGITHSYFTTYVTAKGYKTLNFETEIRIHEEFDGENKHIYIENTGMLDCWARVRIFAPDPINGLEYSEKSLPDAEWVKQDGYWYYTKIIPAKTITPAYVLFEVEKIPKEDKEESPEFNVVVIAECVPARSENEVWTDVDWNVKTIVED